MAKSWEAWGSGNYDKMYDYMFDNNANGFKDYTNSTQAGQNYGKTNINDALTNDYNPSLLDKFYKEMTEIKKSQDNFIDNHIKSKFNNVVLIVGAVACGVIYYKFFYKGAKK